MTSTRTPGRAESDPSLFSRSAAAATQTSRAGTATADRERQAILFRSSHPHRRIRVTASESQMSCPSRCVQVDKPQVSYFRVTLSELYTCGVAVPRSLYQVHRNQDGAAAVSELPYPSRSLRVYRNQRGRSRLGARVRVTATRTRVLGCAASRGGSIKAAAAETPDAQQAAIAAYCYATQLVAAF